ncbi:MAG TPA: hypothetical protein VNN73_00645 [Blastocatellia bacterium]|nr:hypothetical protein [Blastocatellia bacterium]
MGLFDRFKNRKQEEPVQLPASLKAVYLIGGGSGGYSGDLIITEQVIYFLPRKDMVDDKIIREAGLWGGVVGGTLGLASGTVPLTYRERSEAESEPKEPDITGSCAEVQEKLDSYIEQLKSLRRGGRFSSSLPLPMRFHLSEMKNLSCSRGDLKTGRLVFNGAYEQHEFVANQFEPLQAALVEGGFIG